MWIVFLITGIILFTALMLFITTFWKRIDEELLRMESKIDKYNTTIALFVGFLITFLALTFNNKLPYELDIQKAEIKSNQALSAQQQEEIIHKMDLALSDRIFVGTLASLDIAILIGLLLFGTFLPGQILKTKRSRKTYIVLFIISFYIFAMIVASISDNLSR